METVEIIAAVIGLLYLWLEYKADVWLWFVGVIMPLLYIYIFFKSKFYADMAINVYYLFASAYGWWRWQLGSYNKKSRTNDSKVDLTEDMVVSILHTPVRHIWRLSTVFALLFVVIAHILVHYTDSPVPYGDAFTTALSIVGMWMLANKYVEQWWLWVVVNAVSAVLYFNKMLYPTGILYVIYTVVSVFGYLKWKKELGK